MNISRRDAIKNCFIITVGAALIPSCLRESKPSIPLKHLDITGDQEKLISELSAMLGLLSRKQEGTRAAPTVIKKQFFMASRLVILILASLFI